MPVVVLCAGRAWVGAREEAVRNEVRYCVIDEALGGPEPREVRRDESHRDRPEQLGRGHFETEREERERFAGNLARGGCASGSGAGHARGQGGQDARRAERDKMAAAAVDVQLGQEEPEE